ncbi:MAG: 16S rRNA (guanine(527)-N(7))-methyltransferase RsmG [Aeriscardovia sp.]|nr:16S rRNA (guanine(527)-N(7))-methyltransferase RsmG [Aeriscardovia sp.]
MEIESEKMRAFSRLLSSEGPSLGLIGPKEAGRVWERHIGNCAVLAPFLEGAKASRVVDVGSGAGLPGVVLSILLPSVSFTLLEPRALRKQWLDRMKKELDLKNVEVFKIKAEQWRGEKFDAAVCRALAPLPKLMGLLSPLLRPGGAVFALKGRSVEEEMKGAPGAELFHVLQEGGEATNVVSFKARGQR